MEVLRLENLSKFYTTENAVVMGLSGINLSFSTGEFVALTGESGSGKSTLAHVLGGILPYESGELYIYGEPTSHFDSGDWANYRRDKISFISQNYGILPGNTVRENVINALRLSGLSKQEAEQKTVEILQKVELTEFSQRKAGHLSSGQKQRLSIARALAKPSKILIADEPTGNLDRENSEKIISLLRQAAKERLVILITHEFEEAKDAATRRIVLSDGEVVTDAKLQEPIPQAEPQAKEKPQATTSKKKKQVLAPYVVGLSVKSHPIFTTILCILLAATSFITFVFLGTFIIALDDTSTKIYNPSAFYNGTPTRLVAMNADGSPLTEEDYQTLLSLKYVESVDRYGAFNDLIYFYKEGVDHSFHHEVVLGPNYNETLNPDDYSIQPILELFDYGYHFAQTIPLTEESILAQGRAPESVYEVVSADPDLKIGDTVKVYIKNPNQWSVSAYLTLNFTVVGTTEQGEGLYFSQQLADAVVYPSYPFDPPPHYKQWTQMCIFLPYEESQFPLRETAETPVVLEDDEFIFSSKRGTTPMKLGKNLGVIDAAGQEHILSCKELHTASLNLLVLVSENTYQALLQNNSSQASVYMTDYSYTERVVEAIKEEGYMVISPYQLGATTVDEELKQQRVLTLGVCAATFLVAMVLQCILLFTMFASLHEYYKLMANTGLTVPVAYLTISTILLISTLIGEGLGAGAIFLLNGLGIRRIVDIFKYLDPALGVCLFVFHFVLVVISLYFILRRMKGAVFGKNKAKYDIDFSEMEVTAQ